MAKTAKKDVAMSLQDLFLVKIQALYDIENELIKALPKMAKAASDEELKAGFEEHLEQTKEHAKRLEHVFEILGEKPKKLKCEGVRGIIADGEWVVKNVPNAEALDANLIAAAQYAEMYEMAGYGSAKEWAHVLGLTEAEELLAQTLGEEEDTDKKLTQLAVTKINDRANMM